jgi:hypothetical protein
VSARLGHLFQRRWITTRPSVRIFRKSDFVDILFLKKFDGCVAASGDLLSGGCQMMERALLGRRSCPAVAFLAGNAVAFGALIGSVKIDTVNIEWA